MKKIICLFVFFLFLSSCSMKKQENLSKFSIEADRLCLLFDGEEIISSSETYEIDNHQKQKNQESFVLKNMQIRVDCKFEAQYADITFTLLQTDQPVSFRYPLCRANQYLIPIGEGKLIDQHDPVFSDFFQYNDNCINPLEAFSLNLFTLYQEQHAYTMIFRNPFDHLMHCTQNDPLTFEFSQQFIPFSSPSYGIRVIKTEKSPVAVAAAYKNDVQSQGHFVSFSEKIKENPAVEKLLSAPFIYLFDENIVSEQDLNWVALRQQENLFSDFFNNPKLTSHLEKAKANGFFDRYQKQEVLRHLNEYLAYEIDVLEIQTKKNDLYAAFPTVFLRAPNAWALDKGSEILKDLKNEGVDKAVILLNSWEQAFFQPELISTALSCGYLIGPYDSYHSIHKPKEEKWITAKFQDPSLYETKTIKNERNDYEVGFQGVGRKINPAFTEGEVFYRQELMKKNHLSFNAWFVDCDATGEVYHDYSKNTSKSDDLMQRMKRLTTIKNMGPYVMGSEGGNDFAAPYIHFAHGIALPHFAWMDPDMKNKNSPFYLGRYYSPNRGAPDKMTKPAAIKEHFLDIFLNPSNSVPLYSLVYHDSVVISYHWDWASLKIENATSIRSLFSHLYDTPPMFHLDQEFYEKNKNEILSLTKQWQKISQIIAKLPMTDFSYLSEDRLFQQTVFSNRYVSVVNFSTEEKTHQGKVMAPLSSLFYEQ